MATGAVLKPDPQKFPAGTTVKAYKRSAWANQVAVPSGLPEGTQDASATVAADGSVTFTGLAENTDYWIYAATPDRYARFSTRGSAAAQPGSIGAPTTQTSVATSTSSADALAANPAATYRQIQNVDGTNGVTLKLGSGTVTDYQGVYLPPNSVWDCYIGERFYTGLVRCKSVAGTPTLAVIEG